MLLKLLLSLWWSYPRTRLQRNTGGCAVDVRKGNYLTFGKRNTSNGMAPEKDKNSSGDEIANVNFLRQHRTYRGQRLLGYAHSTSS